MDIDRIVDRVLARQAGPIDVEREYAVLLPLIDIRGSWHIVYELRARHMTVQPREISFPGGAVEPGESFSQAALRETVEELNIPYGKIDLIGELNYLVASGAGLRINCFLGILRDLKIEDLRPNPDEVDHVFTVPLDFFLENEPDVYTVKFERNMAPDFPYNLIPNGRDYDWREGKDSIHFYFYRNYIIWGFTAKMTRNFIEIIRD